MTQCNICYDDFLQDEEIFTSECCKKKFHFDCIHKSCVIQSKLECPYCRSQVAQDFKDLQKKCTHKFQSGKNKGNRCTRLIYNNDKCKIHQNKPKKGNDNDNDKGNLCNTILKSGKRKGEKCGKNNCKRHTVITDNLIN